MANRAEALFESAEGEADIRYIKEEKKIAYTLTSSCDKEQVLCEIAKIQKNNPNIRFNT